MSDPATQRDRALTHFPGNAREFSDETRTLFSTLCSIQVDDESLDDESPTCMECLKLQAERDHALVMSFQAEYGAK